MIVSTLLYLAVVGGLGWALCEGLGKLIDWALDVEGGSL